MAAGCYPPEGLICAAPSEKRLARDQAGIGSLSTTPLSGVWRGTDRLASVQNPAPLPVLHGALQARGRLFCRRDPGERRHDGVCDSAGLFLLFDSFGHGIRERTRRTLHHGAGFSRRFLSSQLESMARFRLLRGVAAEVHAVLPV